ncbi:MAG: MATE family efflux transporter [Clostridiales bacterium]|nr:MATE family efflux transporter [Clostridiales bacterium]
MKTLRLKRNVNIDLLNGSIFPSMVAFAIPILFSSLFQQLYNTMDAVIVGHTLGENALAAMGAATPVYDLLIGFALGIGNGLSIVTARSYGTKDEELLKRSVAVSIVIGAAITLTLTVLTRFLLMPFLKLLNTPAEILQEAYSYISVITLFTGVMFAYNLCAGILRAIGNSFMPLLFLILSSVLNIFLDVLFIAGFDMGVMGAAVATVIAQGISVALCVIYIGRCAKILVPSKHHFHFDKGLYMEMAAQGFSMGFMSCLVSAGSAVLQAGINGLGYMVIAGHIAARKLFQLGMMPFLAMISAVSTFVSQNYGAGRVDRIRKAMTYSYWYNAAITIGMTLLMALFAPYMVKLISGSEEPIIIQNGTRYLQVVAPAYFVLGLVNNTRTALQAIGSKILPILSSIIELIGKIVFVIVFIPKFQYNAVIFCEPVIWCFMAVELLIAFWRNPCIRGEKEYAIQRMENNT